MILPVVVRPEAREDLLGARCWYEEQRPGLGDELVTCVEAAIGNASRAPLAHPVVDGPIRRMLVRRFPYAVFFVPGQDRLLVLAVAHTSRRPGCWLDRIGTTSVSEGGECP